MTTTPHRQPVETPTGAQAKAVAAASGLTSANFSSASVDGTAGTASLRTLGTNATQAAAGNHTHTGTAAIATDVLIVANAGAPTDAVAGTGYGTAAVNDMYIKTADGPVVYLMTGTTALPAWTLLAGQPAASGAGAPTDGVTAGTLGDLYEDTTAYGSDPTTGWYVCTDGDADTWAAVTVTVTAGSGVPTDGVAGTGAGTAGKGSLLIDTSTPALYQNSGTKALPAWTAK